MVTGVNVHISIYRNIPKISPGAYIFSKALFEGLIFGGSYIGRGLCTGGNLLIFSKTLFEGLIFGGAYVWREISISKSIRLACSGKEIYHFCFVLLCIRGQIPSTSPPRRAYIRRGDLTEGLLRYDFGGLYLEGLIFGILRYLANL